MTRTSLSASAGVLALLIFLSPSDSGAQSEEFLTALSHRHGAVTLEGLEKIAGSREAVIAGLLAARHKEMPPFAGITAEKLLLKLADRPDVQQALQEDLSSEQHMGLARIVVVHLDEVNDPGVRSRLARFALERASRDRSFQPYARTLLESSDSEVQRMAREALQ